MVVRNWMSFPIFFIVIFLISCGGGDFATETVSVEVTRVVTVTVPIEVTRVIESEVTRIVTETIVEIPEESVTNTRIPIPPSILEDFDYMVFDNYSEYSQLCDTNNIDLCSDKSPIPSKWPAFIVNIDENGKIFESSLSKSVLPTPEPPQPQDSSQLKRFENLVDLGKELAGDFCQKAISRVMVELNRDHKVIYFYDRSGDYWFTSELMFIERNTDDAPLEKGIFLLYCGPTPRIIGAPSNKSGAIIYTIKKGQSIESVRK